MRFQHLGNRESSVHRLLIFGGIMLPVLLGLAIPVLVAYYTLTFFAPGA